MADVNPGAEAQTFTNVSDNARDAAEGILDELDSMSDAQFNEAHGWSEPSAEEREAELMDLGLADEQTAPLVESEEVTGSSPGSGPPSPAPAPQLDPTQQMMAAMLQRMDAQQQAFERTLQQLAPKPPAPTPVDPLADMPPELRAEVEKNPQLKLFTEWMTKKAATPAEQYKQDFERRIAEAQQQREVQRYETEADSVANGILGANFDFSKNPGFKNQAADAIRDWALSLSHAHGGTPAQYMEPLKNVVNGLVASQMVALNSKAKASVAQRQPGSVARPQAAGPAIPSFQNRTPTDAEARAAGYKSAMDAALDGDRRVHQMWAKQARGK